MSHKWTGAKPHRRHGHGGDEYVEPGEEFEPTDAELRAFAGRIEAVSDDESEGSDGDDTPADDDNGNDDNGNDDNDSAESLTDLDGVGESTADELRDAGYESVADVRSADAGQLVDDVDGIGQSLAESLTNDE